MLIYYKYFIGRRKILYETFQISEKKNEFVFKSDIFLKIYKLVSRRIHCKSHFFINIFFFLFLFSFTFFVSFSFLFFLLYLRLRFMIQDIVKHFLPIVSINFLSYAMCPKKIIFAFWS